MPAYAQTILQLYNQLQDHGYSKSDLIQVRDTYDLAMSVFACHYQPSGKTFIAHGVGVASILSSLKQSSQLISAGLIHNIYQKGDFGTGVKGVSGGKRKYLKQTLGKEVEEYVARFAAMKWNPQNISSLKDSTGKLNQTDRAVILIHLADYLEHLLDYDVLYFDESKHKRYTSNTAIHSELAYKLGFPALSSEIDSIARELEHVVIPAELINQRSESYTIPPKSYRKRLPAMLVQKLNYLHSKIKLRKILSFLIKTR